MKFLLVMYICSTIAGNTCKQVQVNISEFQDHYDCAIHGYKFARETILKFDRKFINENFKNAGIPIFSSSYKTNIIFSST